MQRVAVINVVGLSSSLMGEDTPRLSAFAAECGMASFSPAFPAVTCTAQASMLTGRSAAQHGIVGNGWYDREFAEVRFWKQSNAIVRGAKVWDRLRERAPDTCCAQLFWWYNMHARVDYSITPRPLYLADGRKVFDIHTQPMGWREEIKAELGEFPFTSFWGPGSGIACSDWIAAAARSIERRASPGLSLVYLPHLDYSLQKFGPGSAEAREAVRRIDERAGGLIDDLRGRGVRPLVVSEYGISPVRRPVHLNRRFRERGWIQVKDELGRETLDVGGCEVFAVADHQIAHIYVRDPARIGEVADVLRQEEGVEEVRDPRTHWGPGVGSERAGDLIAVAEADAWFTYYYWEDDARAPDFARTVDIHRKPGYDPVELFIDPELRFPSWRVAQFLLKKKLGFRALLDVVPLDASLVRGSHGRDAVPPGEQPVVIGTRRPIGSHEAIFGEILRLADGEL